MENRPISRRIALLARTARASAAAVFGSRTAIARPRAPAVTLPSPAKKQLDAIVYRIYTRSLIELLVVAASAIAGAFVLYTGVFQAAWAGFLSGYTGEAPPEPTDPPLSDFPGWVVEQRDPWDSLVLIELPAVLILPAFLAVLLPRVARVSTEKLQVQEVAWMHVIDDLLRVGLASASALALCAVIPTAQGPDLPTQAVGGGLAYLCLVLRQLLVPRGPMREHRQTRAEAELRDVRSRRRDLGRDISASTSMVRRLLGRPKHTVAAVWVVASAGVLCPPYAALLLNRESVHTVIAFTLIFAPLIVLTFSASAVVLTRRQARKRVGLLATVPTSSLTVVGMIVLLFTGILAGNGEYVVVAVVLSMLLIVVATPFLIGRSTLGAILDYHALAKRVTALEDELVLLSGYAD